MNLYETVTNKILDALKKGVVPWRKPWDASSSVPVSVASGNPYRGVNLFLLAMSPYTDHRWLTFRQVQERGGRIRPGEKGTLVIFWKRWEPQHDEAADEQERPHVPLLRQYSVFNAEQCEGLDLPELLRPEQAREHQRIARADLLVDAMPDRPAIREGGKAAWYRPKDDLVNIPSMRLYETPDAYYATLFHELGHATGHQKRLNRNGVADVIQFGSGEYSREELVAELTSAFCCAAVSLDNSLLDEAASYIDGWLGVIRNDPKAVVIAAAQAQRAADYIRGVTYQCH